MITTRFVPEKLSMFDAAYLLGRFDQILGLEFEKNQGNFGTLGVLSWCTVTILKAVI